MYRTALLSCLVGLTLRCAGGTGGADSRGAVDSGGATDSGTDTDTPFMGHALLEPGRTYNTAHRGGARVCGREHTLYAVLRAR